MSNLGSSIVRGMGYTIGRNIVNSATRGYGGSSNSARRNASSHYTNHEINSKVGVDIEIELQNDIDNKVSSIQYLKEEYTSKEKVISRIIGFTFSMMLFLIPGELFFQSEENVSADFKLGTLLFFTWWIPHLIITKVVRKKLYSQNRIDRYNDELEEIKRYGVIKSAIINGIVKTIDDKYGDDVVNKMRNRDVEKGLPIEGFTTFFGEPNDTEITSNTTTYVYGTSKRVGDWFKFKDDKLVDFSIK